MVLPFEVEAPHPFLGQFHRQRADQTYARLFVGTRSSILIERMRCPSGNSCVPAATARLG